LLFASFDLWLKPRYIDYKPTTLFRSDDFKRT
jgi:hypothetical protein